MTLALFTAGGLGTFEVPFRVVPSAAAAIGAGACAGGFRLTPMPGRRIIPLTPAGGLAAQPAASSPAAGAAVVTAHHVTDSVVG